MTSPVRLGDIGSTYGGLAGKTKRHFGQGNASYVTFLEVINSTRLRGRALERVRVARGERQHRVMRGDILFNGSSETPDELALSAVVDFDPSAATYLNSFCFGFRLRPAAPVDPTYLAYFFRSAVGRSLVAALAQGATRYNIAKTKFFDLELPFPPIGRQRQIVERLCDTDDLIDALGRAIVKKQSVRDGMMQELLSGQTRLPGFTAPWTEVTVADLAETVSGGTPRSTVPAFWNGGIPWCTPTDITRETGRYLTRTERTISRQGLDRSAAQLLPAGSLLLCTRATIGEVKIAQAPTATNQGFKSLVPRPGVSSEFLYYTVLTLKDRLVAKATGSTFLEISKRDVDDIRLHVPGTDEQRAIADVLVDADDAIELRRARLAKVRGLKLGMMQEMLTGGTGPPIADRAP